MSTGTPPPLPPLPPLPPGMALALDPAARRIDGGTVLVGGTPLRLLRLTPAGARLVDRLAAGEPVPAAPAAQRLARRLLDAAMAHPRPAALTPPCTARQVAAVVPAHDRPGGLARTLDRLGDVGEVVVVDDGSADAAATATVAARAGARLVRHDRARGPAAARNAGWRAVEAPVIAFVDADVEPEPGWLDPLLAHLADAAVAAVAPRVAPLDTPGTPRWLAAYEAVRSPLDLGADEAIVRPGSRVSYVPTAALVVRRSALAEVGGFDESMLYGEDVDLVWRLARAGATVRYEPASLVRHPVRRTLGAWLRQRYAYGSSAAPLAARHAGAVAPLTVSGWSAAAWGLVAAGAPAAGAALGAATTAALVPKLRSLRHPVRESLRLAGLGNLYAGRQVADALRRAWFPLAVPLALRRRSRPALVAALVVPALVEQVERRPRLDPVRWAALRLADDLAYGAGLWSGSIRARTTAALRPAFSGRFPPPDDGDGSAAPAPGGAVGSSR
ncbi:MAG TPA: mycofactocin biosynthesis glycosyltransferase MftF [Acidimicrobiales bacterium]|nr:mycofactocin biosynthesis glycosyltransferase MftF [Acidimicrobiales bacterium]